MNVSSVQSTAAAAVAGVIKTSTAVATPTATTSTSTEDVFTSKIAAIAAKYDPRHMTLEQVPELGNELLKNGLITGTESVVFSSLPIIARSLKGNETIGLNKGTDGKIDLLQFTQTQFNTAKAFGNKEQLDGQENTINTLEAMSTYRKTQSGSAASQSALDVRGAISAYETGIDNSTVDTQRVMSVLEAIVANRENKPLSS